VGFPADANDWEEGGSREKGEKRRSREKKKGSIHLVIRDEKHSTLSIGEKRWKKGGRSIVFGRGPVLGSQKKKVRINYRRRKGHRRMVGAYDQRQSQERGEFLSEWGAKRGPSSKRKKPS